MHDLESEIGVAAWQGRTEASHTKGTACAKAQRYEWAWNGQGPLEG